MHNEELKEQIRELIEANQYLSDFNGYLSSEDWHLDFKDPAGRSFLSVAAHHGQADIVSGLIEYGLDINHVDAFGETVLFYAVLSGSLETVKLLLSCGADVDKSSCVALNGGCTPLMQASRSGNLDMVRMLLSAGADVNLIPETGDESALVYAAMEGHTEVVKTLLDAGANVNLQGIQLGKTPLMMAALRGHSEVVDLLLERGAEVNIASTFDRYTALMHATQRGNVDIMGKLLEKGADASAVAEFKCTAVHLAVLYDQEDALDCLIEAHATLNEQYFGDTPLMLAAMKGKLPFVDKLINAGADIACAAKSGDTALTYAQLEGHQAVIDRLQSVPSSDGSATLFRDSAGDAPSERDGSPRVCVMQK